jgi:CRISPR/Cas system endoribonuclease Cas6 (RAMP superfamily)
MRSIKLPLFTGYIARGLALYMLRTINPTISQNLHERNSVKPYSVTPLYFKSSKKFADGYEIDTSSPCIFKIRLLDDSIVKNLMDYLLSHESIMIFDTMFKIDSTNMRTRL